MSNKINKIRRVNHRTYIDIECDNDKSPLTIKILDPKRLLSDDTLYLVINSLVYTSNNCQEQFRNDGLTHIDVIESISDYITSKRLNNDVFILGQYNTKRYKFNITNIGKKSFIAYAHYSIGWADELFTFIRGSKDEATESIKNMPGFILEKKEEYDSDIKFLLKENGISETVVFSIDSIEEFVMCKELNGREVQTLVELGMIEPIGPWKPYKNIMNKNNTSLLSLNNS